MKKKFLIILLGICILFLLGLSVLVNAVPYISGDTVTINTTTTSANPWQSYRRSICRDSSSNIHITWRKGATGIYYANSLDNGITWDSKEMFGGIANAPSIACTGSKIYTVYWDAADILYINRSLDNGATFTNLSLPEGFKYHSASVQVQAKGDRVYVVSVNKTADNVTILFSNSSDTGDTWSDIQQIMVPNGIGADMEHPSMVIDGTGTTSDKIYVVSRHYNGSNDIVFVNSTDGGDTWGGKMKVLGVIGKTLDHPSIAFNGNNIYVVAYSTDDNIYFTNSSDNGITWSSTTRIDTSIQEATNPSVSTKQDGYPIVFWEQNDSNANYDIVYRAYENGWGNVTYLTNDTSGNEQANANFEYVSGRIDIIFQSGISSPYNISYNYVYANTSSGNGDDGIRYEYDDEFDNQSTFNVLWTNNSNQSFGMIFGVVGNNTIFNITHSTNISIMPDLDNESPKIRMPIDLPKFNVTIKLNQTVLASTLAGASFGGIGIWNNTLDGNFSSWFFCAANAYNEYYNGYWYVENNVQIVTDNNYPSPFGDVASNQSDNHILRISKETLSNGSINMSCWMGSETNYTHSDPLYYVGHQVLPNDFSDPYIGLNVKNVVYNNPSSLVVDWFRVDQPFANSSMNYSGSVIESQEQTITLIVNSSETINNLTGTLFYNGTEYYYDSSSLSGIFGNLSVTFFTPSVVEDSETKNFYWNYSMNSWSSMNSSTYNQTVNKMVLTNCSSGYEVLRFVSIDEESLVNVSANIDITFDVWQEPNRGYKRNYSFSLRNNYNYSICAMNTTTNYNVDAVMSYENNVSGFTTRSYYLINYSLTNVASYVYLYLLSTANSSKVYVYTKDQDDEALKGHYVKALRYYPGTNTYRTVEISKSNNDGVSLFHLVGYDVWYKFFVQDGTQTIFVSESTKILSSEIYFYIRIIEDPVSIFSRARNLDYDLLYDNVTQTFVFTYNDVSNIVRDGCLVVSKMGQRSDEVLCNTCETSSATTLSCTIPGTMSGTYIAKAYIDTTSINSNFLVDFIEVIVSVTHEMFGQVGTISTFILGGTFAFIGLWNPVAAVMLSIVALIFSVWLGIFYMSYVSLVILIVFGLILLFKLRS